MTESKTNNSERLHARIHFGFRVLWEIYGGIVALNGGGKTKEGAKRTSDTASLFVSGLSKVLLQTIQGEENEVLLTPDEQRFADLYHLICSEFEQVIEKSNLYIGQIPTIMVVTKVQLLIVQAVDNIFEYLNPLCEHKG